MTLEDASLVVHDALPAKWHVGLASVCGPLRGTWIVSAIGPHPRRGKIPQTVTGTGEDEVAALVDLDRQPGATGFRG
jgi:hypothetical protein